MKASDVIRAKKLDIQVSGWTEETLKSKDFPMSKKRGKAFPLTRRWRWSVAGFRIGQRHFKALFAYHTQLPEILVTLAEYVDGDCRVLCRWEYHESHPGWHVHANCGPIDSTALGVVKPTGARRIPAAGSHHRHVTMVAHGARMDDSIAMAIGCSLCGIPHTGDMFTMNALPWV